MRKRPPPGGEGLGAEALEVDGFYEDDEPIENIRRILARPPDWVTAPSEAWLERERPVKGALRQEVIDRDNSCCRVCGRYVDTPALHHIQYKSQGGLDVASNLVTVGWLPGHDCHLAVVHANKRVWQPIMKLVVQHPGVSGLQILRWSGHL